MTFRSFEEATRTLYEGLSESENSSIEGTIGIDKGSN
jgi:hypothetical protein